MSKRDDVKTLKDLIKDKKSQLGVAERHCENSSWSNANDNADYFTLESELSDLEESLRVLEESQAFRVIFATEEHIVVMDRDTTDYGAILDILIDRLESEGRTDCFTSLEKTSDYGSVDAVEYNSDEYVIGGNHGLVLVHNGNFRIEKVED